MRDDGFALVAFLRAPSLAWRKPLGVFNDFSAFGPLRRRRVSCFCTPVLTNGGLCLCWNSRLQDAEVLRHHIDLSFSFLSSVYFEWRKVSIHAAVRDEGWNFVPSVSKQSIAFAYSAVAPVCGFARNLCGGFGLFIWRLVRCTFGSLLQRLHINADGGWRLCQTCQIRIYRLLATEFSREVRVRFFVKTRTCSVKLDGPVCREFLDRLFEASCNC